MSKSFLGGILVGSGLVVGCLGAYVMLYYVYTDSGRSFQPALLFVLIAILEIFGLFLPFLMQSKQCIVSLKLLPLSILAIQMPTILFLIYCCLSYRFI